MPQISAMYVRKQIEQAHGLPDKDALFALTGLSAEAAANPANMVSAKDYHYLLEVIAENEKPDIRFHMRTSAAMKCGEFGAFGLAMKSAPTLRQALDRNLRYIRLHNRVSEFDCTESDGIVSWTHHKPRSDNLGSHLSNEAAMATTLTLCREASFADLTPLRVQFAHQRDGSKQALAEHFGIEPVFGQEVDGLRFRAEDMDRPAPVGDASIWQFFRDHLETQIAADEEEVPLESQVVEEIARLLSGGVPPLDQVAETLGLGARTLQRRLAAQDLSYQGLVDEARQQMARKLLSQSRYSLAEIAFLAGFSEQSAFTRAFKRWSGQTPRAYRAGLVG
ncbi:MAG: AraC family transcriptional regulator [Silicimonas sp.]|nr:AraC family transcriptional regulator [Silicimonas sp.]